MSAIVTAPVIVTNAPVIPMAYARSRPSCRYGTLAKPSSISITQRRVLAFIPRNDIGCSGDTVRAPLLARVGCLDGRSLPAGSFRLTVPGGGQVELTFERAIERGFGLVADGARDLRHALVRGGERVGAEA